MEDKKTLWIILGVGVCVLIVTAVGFFWFLPSDQSLAATGGSEGVVNAGRAGFDAVEWVRQDESFPGIKEETEQPDDFVVVSEELVYGLPEDGGNSANARNDVKQEGETITLNIPEAEPVKKAPAAELAAAPVRTAAPQQQAKPVEKKSVRVTEYWIQAGSFSSLAKATEVREKLSDNGALSTVSTTNVNGTNFYRVRLGPYSDQMEADKFLTWIKAVEGFENSYISEVYVTR